ncbi:hypothetical protein SAMN04487944_101563 [Gracilibacillus ureilyticus]|uniref:LURP-one-related n=1 Tax=Gracilibacillus ureilyticus TaxID=531814 RepID=A0A1H9M5C9_9BACI|nr:hypothetical protein [Gracilibacillus ureilyticus]SER18854.1 hypothetical protein SAMN04487944_101563 [Gracilibacillus ureilyticus]
MEQTIYIADNFFSAGKTMIKNRNNEEIGLLDLKSAFGSSISVYDLEGNVLISAKFRPFSTKWVVSDPVCERGILKQKLFSFSRTYYYTTANQEVWEINKPAFSRDFTMKDHNNNTVAEFKKISGFFSSPAYEINNLMNKLETEELIAVVMGVNAIEKSNGAAAGGAST